MTSMNMWADSPQDYVTMHHESIDKMLHPAIRKVVTRRDPAVLLDYGCGDGRLLASLPAAEKRHAYDISLRMLGLAQNRLGENVTYHTDPKKIPRDTFDVVVCSLVLMMISNATEYFNTVKELAACCSPGGRVIIALTHPCFRHHKFSDFETEYTSNVPFDYFNEGVPFSVTLGGVLNQKSLVIRDYHYTLGFTVRSIVDSGMRILDIFEVSDLKSDFDGIVRVPPYLIFECERRM